MVPLSAFDLSSRMTSEIPRTLRNYLENRLTCMNLRVRGGGGGEVFPASHVHSDWNFVKTTSSLRRLLSSKYHGRNMFVLSLRCRISMGAHIVWRRWAPRLLFFLANSFLPKKFFHAYTKKILDAPLFVFSVSGRTADVVEAATPSSKRRRTISELDDTGSNETVPVKAQSKSKYNSDLLFWMLTPRETGSRIRLRIHHAQSSSPQSALHGTMVPWVAMRGFDHVNETDFLVCANPQWRMGHSTR